MISASILSFYKIGALCLARFPWILDAVAEVAVGKGKEFMVDFGEIMTGVRPKSSILKPRLLLPLLHAVLNNFFRVVICRKPRDYCGEHIERQAKRRR